MQFQVSKIHELIKSGILCFRKKRNLKDGCHEISCVFQYNCLAQRREEKVSNMENKNNNLLWLCINKYAPELKINNIKETLIKTGVTFF